MKNIQPVIVATKNIEQISAFVRNAPANTIILWTAELNGNVFASKKLPANEHWEIQLNNPSGIIKLIAEINSGNSAIMKIESIDLHFRTNRQHIPPRKPRIARPNEYPPSFKALVFQEARKSFSRPEYTPWLLDDKLNAYQFGDSLGYSTPVLDRKPLALTDLHLESGTVIKPLTGVMSQGVFIIKENESIEISSGTVYKDKDSLVARLKELLASKTIKKDAWIREKLIYSDIEEGQPARDLKFYTFYGQVKLVLETIRTNGTVRCWYDQSLNTIDTGKYSRKLFPGNGIPLEYFKAAEHIGSAVPSPFIRIDFLASNEGVVLNEITPRPGGSNQFSESVDQSLGEYLITADARLRRDMLQGKQFTNFNNLTASAVKEESL